jgi:hypothetical protein
VKLAQEKLDIPAYDNVRSQFLDELDINIDTWKETPKLRTCIGTAAKKAGWFKDTTRGDLWFKAISPAYIVPDFVTKNLAAKLGKLWEWAEHV